MTWRNELNAVFPSRDKASDGTVGDLRHQQGTSGHNPDEQGHAEFNDRDGRNEVRAFDADSDLRHPKVNMEMVIQWLITKGRAGDYLPFRYIIYKRRIWRKSTGWKTEKYTGANAHDKHAHFSGDYTKKADEWEGSLGLYDFVKKITGPPAKPVEAPMFDNDEKEFLKTETAGVWNRALIPTLPGIQDDDGKMTAMDVVTRIYLRANAANNGVTALSAAFSTFVMDEISRDAQDAARDAALLAAITALANLMKDGIGVKLTDAQFTELMNFIGQKIVEAGQDAADQAQVKLNLIAEALDNAGEALSSAGGVAAQPN